MGFGLNFAGGDVRYTGEKFALTIGLQFGTAAPTSATKRGFKSDFCFQAGSPLVLSSS